MADAPVQAQLVAHAKQWNWPLGCLRCQPAHWPITLHFIGAVGANQVELLAASVTVPFQPLVLVLDRPVLWTVPGYALGLSTGGMPQRYRVIRQYGCPQRSHFAGSMMKYLLPH